ncbi:MAG: polysaccharide deacetylase, partial [Gammaproteobacteria bacterium]|nr:polysaccharide deacetylase [Gammaproteobacteria bacterium]
MHRFQGLRPYTPPTAVFDVFKREFDRARIENGLFLLTMHPHVIGYRSRIWILEALITHMKASAKVWFATHAEIARYVLK